MLPFPLILPTNHIDLPVSYTASKVVRLNDNGAWSWFMDERAIVYDGKLIVGSVRATGKYENSKDPDWGNVEVSVLDIRTRKTANAILHRHLEQDDHDGPAFLPLPDGRILAVYTKHSAGRIIYFRTSEPHNPLVWGPEREFESPGRDSRAFSGDNVTYSNLFRFPSGRIYDFYRGIGHEPNYLISDDSGQTWRYGGHVLRGKGGYSPYQKYAFDGKGTIHFVTTEDHPRNFDNSVYHGFIRDGVIHFSNGKPCASLSTSQVAGIAAWDLTKVFAGDPDNVAWVTDLELDAKQRPCVVFTVQKDGRGLPPKQGGFDHRFYYGRWDGAAWQVHEIAHAGTRLYAGEDDYTGLASIDPGRTNVVYISTDAQPVSGAPLVSRADGKRHRELYRGTSSDGGASWTWEALTANSTADNLRPLVPKWRDRRTALVWMRGTYSNNHGEWTTAVVAMILGPGADRTTARDR